MKTPLQQLNGLHPGLFLERRLKDQNLRKGQLALAVNEYPQTITAITKGKRDMNTALALKLERALGLEEGTLMILQVYHDIKEIRKKQQNKPDLRKLRPILFWDTDLEAIDWDRQYRAVIKRIFERGNEREKKEITKFYGAGKIKEVIAN